MCLSNEVLGVITGLGLIGFLFVLVHFVRFLKRAVSIYQYMKTLAEARIHMYTAKEDFDAERTSIEDRRKENWKLSRDFDDLKKQIAMWVTDEVKRVTTKGKRNV